MNPSELLPCPFCGKDLDVSQRKYNQHARCVTENCKGAQLPLLNIELLDDVSRWNTRAKSAPPSPDAELVELLRECRGIVAKEVERWNKVAAFLLDGGRVESGLLARIDAKLASVKPKGEPCAE